MREKRKNYREIAKLEKKGRERDEYRNEGTMVQNNQE